jgi:hypothetical protein
MIKIVSYYTANGIYKEMSKRLIESLDKFKFQYNIEEKFDQGSWVKNCAMKADFLYNKLKCANYGDAIVWIDVDAIVVDYPEIFFQEDFDFAIRAEPGNRTKTPAGRETISLPLAWSHEPAWFNSGTIFFRKTDSVMELLFRWIELKNQNPSHWDQWTLQQAWCDVQPKTKWLPRSYCQINKMHGSEGAVILHDLASVIQKVDRK